MLLGCVDAVAVVPVLVVSHHFALGELREALLMATGAVLQTMLSLMAQ
ncbi:MAG: hypothetical protein KC481_12180 [Acidimicrobiaceae bacterium]|nr:hypothetical protein [Acidimicrobiaceae bacterium]MDC1389376.1 hypothetical protein [Acidimicrobiales bacterium]MDG1088837.1 hypothetical protein [Acidimicrobiales bacterium]